MPVLSRYSSSPWWLTPARGRPTRREPLWRGMTRQETTSSPTCQSARCSCASAPTSITTGSPTSHCRRARLGATPAASWLLFRGQSDGTYVYWATLFFSPGAASVRALARGTSEMTLYVRMGASRGSVYMYRVTSAEVARVSELSLDLERPSDRERYDALLRPELQLPLEHCRLLEYRQDAANCWRPGFGLR